MSESSGRDDHRGRSNATPPKQRDLGARSKIGGVAIVILCGIYSLAAPSLNARFGWNLPEIRTDSRHDARRADAWQSTSRYESSNTQAASATRLTAGQSKTDSKTKKNASSAAIHNPQRPAEQEEIQPNADPGGGGASSNRSNDHARGPPGKGSSSADRSEIADAATTGDLLYGILREVSHDRFISPAGLQYTPGSAEGHRLEHLRRHIKDNPGRPGNHGVFDGGMEGALKTIDRAYRRAKTGQRTTKKVDDGRTIYTVDMGGRIGFVGGREGGRKRNPMARRVRLVLEGTRVITAYPM